MKDSLRETLERREQYYPPHYYKGLIEAYAEDMEIPRSQVSVMAVKNFFDSMPKEKIETLRGKAKTY